MEYLTITGAVRLVHTIDELHVSQLIKQFHTMEFDRVDHIDIDRNNQLLMLSIEGEISGDTSITMIDLLNTLNRYTTKQSLIVINRIRWEMNVTLMSEAFTAISNTLHQQESHQIVIF